MQPQAIVVGVGVVFEVELAVVEIIAAVLAVTGVDSVRDGVLLALLGG